MNIISVRNYLFYHVTLESSEDRPPPLALFPTNLCLVYTKYSINIFCLTNYERDNTNTRVYIEELPHQLLTSLSQASYLTAVDSVPGTDSPLEDTLGTEECARQVKVPVLIEINFR